MCGIIALVGEYPVATDLVHGLLQLQHRGQDAAGIATLDSSGQVHVVKDRGLVGEVFKSDLLSSLEGKMGIGHVRYATSGGVGTGEVQPFADEGFAVAFNGNLVNYLQLRRELEAVGVNFSTASDGEVLFQLLRRGIKQQGLEGAVREIYQRIEGAYSVVGVSAAEGLFAFRDPQGLRPLVMGSFPENGGYGAASETYALSFLGYEKLQDVAPGTLVWMGNRVTTRLLHQQSFRHCSFEYAYFTKGNAVLEGKDVYQVRAALGSQLAKKIREAGIQADVVTAVPNTGHPSALRLAWELGIPIEEGLLRRENAGRTFILPSQKQRERAVSTKLAPVPSVFEGRRVIVVDDSIVRGTVSRRIVRMARNCGAKEVIFASTFPPITHPCFYGIDMPRPEELLARARGLEAIEEAIGADRVIYNDLQGLKEAIGLDTLCLACVNGDYPTPLSGALELQQMRETDRQAQEQEAICASR